MLSLGLFLVFNFKFFDFDWVLWFLNVDLFHNFMFILGLIGGSADLASHHILCGEQWGQCKIGTSRCCLY